MKFLIRFFTGGIGHELGQRMAKEALERGDILKTEKTILIEILAELKKLNKRKCKCEHS